MIGLQKWQGKTQEMSFNNHKKTIITVTLFLKKRTHQKVQKLFRPKRTERQNVMTNCRSTRVHKMNTQREFVFFFLLTHARAPRAQNGESLLNKRKTKERWRFLASRAQQAEHKNAQNINNKFNTAKNDQPDLVIRDGFARTTTSMSRANRSFFMHTRIFLCTHGERTHTR